MHNLDDNIKLAVIGLGYVGLPLAVEFGKQMPTLGFDINRQRVRELQEGIDNTLEITTAELANCPHLTFSSEAADLKHSNVLIVTVPTPIDRHKQPDLDPLKAASKTVGQNLNPGDIVIYESTVFPGATEDICIPILEQESGLIFNKDFYAGYSPERINPGDKQHSVADIIKVTSGSTPEIADFVDQLYAKIITAGTHKAPSIKTAEAAKVIENTQRDLNIALVNELAVIFKLIGVDTEEVLKAAGTKWNFLPFRPGLVGGHCIGVDPYYLTHKAQELGYHPEVILAGRRINDDMGVYVAENIIKLLTQNKIHVVGAKVLILGLTFKENCPDIRNTKVIDIASELRRYHAEVDVYDPWASSEEAKSQYGISLIEEPKQGKYDAIIIAVAHKQFREMGTEKIRSFGKPQNVIFDVKYILPADAVDARL